MIIIIIRWQRFSDLKQTLSENSSEFGVILTTGTKYLCISIATSELCM